MNKKEIAPSTELSKFILFLLMVILLTACQENDKYKPGEAAMKATLEAPYSPICTVYDERFPQNQEYLYSSNDTYLDYADICALREMGITPEALAYIRERTYYIGYKNKAGEAAYCTAWLAQQSEDGATLVTNKHCDISEGGELKIIRLGIDLMPRYTEILERTTHPNADLAAIRVRHSSILPPNLEPLEFTTQKLSLGEPMITVGFPGVMARNGSVSVQILFVSESDRGYFTANGLSGRGGSGSPVITLIKDGQVSKEGSPQVVGVIYASPSRDGSVLLSADHPLNLEGGKVVYMEEGKLISGLFPANK